MNLEEELRVTLHDRATAAMPPDDLLNDITTGVRRERRRRRLVAGGAAVVVAATALGVPMMARNDVEPVRPRPLPAASPSADWTGGPWTPTPSFSMRPGWLPEDRGAAQVLQLGPNEVLQFEKEGDVLSAEVGPLEPSWEVEATGEHTTDIGGQTATVRTSNNYDGSRPGDRYVAVRWKTPNSGLWVQVLSFGPRAEAEVLRFARELGNGSGAVSAGPAPFTFAEVPGRMTTQQQSPEMVCFMPRQQPQQQRQPEGLCVGVLKEPFSRQPEGERLTVAGKEAELFLESGSLNIDLGGRVLEIYWETAKVPLTKAEVLRFAEGITYHG